MPTPELTDDQIADAIAEEVVRRIAESHPHATGKFLRMLVRLYTRQATGAEKPPGRITDSALADYFGEAPQRISETRASGLARAYQSYRARFPELI